MMQAADKIPDAQAPLGCGRQSEAPAAVDAFVRHVVAMRDTVARSGLFQGPDGSRDMAHVIAAHHVMLIADAIGPLVAVGQQNAGHLESTYREDDVRGTCRELLSRKVAQDDRLDGFPVRMKHNPDEVRVEQYPYVGSGSEPPLIAGGKVGRATETLERIGRKV